MVINLDLDLRVLCEVRAAAASDITALKRLEDETFDYDRLTLRAIRHSIQAQTQAVLVLSEVQQKGMVLGAAYLHFRACSRACRLYSLAVIATHRIAGLGTRLLFAAEGKARERKCTEMRLEVRADNLAAQRFYERNGYARLFVKTAYYSDGADALRMRKALS